MHGRPPQDRYVFKPFFGSSHHWAFGVLGDRSFDGALDIGPGSGVFGRHLRETGSRSVCAVEIDAAARGHLQPIYDRIDERVEAFSSAKFQLILLLDVLEHMVDPEAFLASVVPLLADEGTMLVSVPNVAHWSVRLPLLFGWFEYTERGILDRTHYQFFTRRRFTRLLSKSGLAVAAVGATIAPMELALPKPLFENPVFTAAAHLRYRAAHWLPGLCAYQHVAVLKNRPQRR